MKVTKSQAKKSRNGATHVCFVGIDEFRIHSRHLYKQSTGTNAQEHVQMDRFQRPIQRRLLFQSFPSKDNLLDSLSGSKNLTQSFTRGSLFEALESSLKTVTSSKGHGLASTHLQGSNGNQLGYIFRYVGLTIGPGKELYSCSLGDWKIKHDLCSHFIDPGKWDSQTQCNRGTHCSRASISI